MRWVWLLTAVALSFPTLAAAAIRTLFVGINHYQYTAQAEHDVTFKDLHAAVADVIMVKAALAQAYPTLPVANRGGGRCGAASDFQTGARSVTLLDECASRRNIMAAFQGAVAASRSGDIVLFYFAGHGSQIDDDDGIEYNGRNDTIVQADARLGPGAYYHDILGVELRAVIDSEAPGVKVVTIFDSCNSGKATRGLNALPSAQARLAPRPPIGVARPVVPASVLNDRVGDVHLAAAADGVAANEDEIAALPGHPAHGIFSYAITRALRDAAHNGGHAVSYADIFTAASQVVTDLGYGVQQPQRSGDLHAIFLGQGAVASRVEPVSRVAGRLTLAIGSLGGISAGSSYGLFPTSGEAGGRQAPSFTATVDDGVTLYSANLTAQGAPPPWPTVWARETNHRFALRTVTYRIDPATPRAGEIAAALKSADALQADGRNPAYVFGKNDRDDIQVSEASGEPVGIPIAGNLDPDAFKAKIAEAAARIARYHEVLALAQGASGTPPKLWIGGPADNGPPTTGGGGRFEGTPFVKFPLDKTLKLNIALINTAATPRYVYLVDFEIDRSIYLVYPGPHEQTPLAPGAGVYVPQIRAPNPQTPGRSQLMLLTTAQPIDAAAFEQSGVGRGIGAQSPLEKLLWTAAKGSRGLGDPPVAPDWGAAMAIVDVTTAPAGRP